VAFLGEIPVKPIATGTGFIDKDQMLGLGLHLADEVVNVTLAGADGPRVDDLGGMVFGNMGDRDGIFVHIQPNIECARLAHG
jgi:hypothetical protein